MTHFVPANVRRRTPKEAIELLQEWLDITPLSAIVTLENMMCAAHMLKLYKHFFPKQYAASRANDRRSTNRRFSSYTDKEQEFLRLLENTIPINEFYLEVEEERFDCIPLNVASVDYEDVENYATPIVVFWTLYQGEEGIQDPCSFWDRIEAELPPGAELPVFRDEERSGPFEIDWKKFERLFRKTFPGHIRRSLRWLMKFVCYSTGNEFLDTTADMLGNSTLPSWNIREIRWLMEEWSRAEKINHEIDRARTWLEADHCRGLADFIHIWNQCTVETPAQPGKPAKS